MQTIVRNVSEQIAEGLRLDLMAGLFQPGDSLREESLAERFGVSRHPVRRALQQLVQEGWLDAKRNCGVRVAQPIAPHIRDLLSPIRAQLETYALRLSYKELHDANFACLDPVLARLRFACEQRDSAAILDRDFEFHRCLLEAAGLQEIVPIWRSVIGRMRDFHADSNRAIPDPRAIHFVHRRLADEFKSGDVERSIAALRDHILNGPFHRESYARWQQAQNGNHSPDGVVA